MSGVNRALDRALGYEDEYRSSQLTRDAAFVIWNSSNWWAESYIVPSGDRVHIRAPLSQSEYLICKIAESTIRKAMRNDH